MPDTEAKGDFLMFRETLTQHKILFNLRGGLLIGLYGTTPIGEGIIYMLKFVTEIEVNTSELNAIEELERLVNQGENAEKQYYRKLNGTFSSDDVPRFD